MFNLNSNAIYFKTQKLFFNQNIFERAQNTTKINILEIFKPDSFPIIEN